MIRHPLGADAPADPANETARALDAVRRESEARIAALLRTDGPVAASPEIRDVLHELGVHQVELEMQNEQLRQIQAALELSRDRYLDLYEHAPVGYVTTGMDGMVIDANRLAAGMFGMPKDHVVQRRLTEFVAMDDRPLLHQHQTLLLRGDGAQSLELRLVVRGAATLVVAVQMALVMDEQTRQAQCRLALIDVSERVRMQKSVARMSAVVASSDDAIVSRDGDGRVTTWNGGAERLFGLPAAAMLGQTLDALVPLERRADEAALLQRVCNGEKIANLESERVGAGGVVVPVSISLSAVRDARGSVIGSAMVARNISERRRADRVMHERLRQLDLLSHAGQALIMAEHGASPLPRDLLERMRGAVGSEICLNFCTGDTPDRLVLMSAHGLSDAMMARMASVPVGDSLCGLVAQRHELLVVSHLQDSTLPEARLLQSAGVRCYAGFPLHFHGRFYGVAAFASTTRDQFRDGDLQVIQTVCDQVSAVFERSRLQDELHASEQSLKLADRAKDDFIAILAHELRNPLAPIRNALGILRQSDMRNPQQLNWCRDVIDRQVMQMTHLLEDLLDVSRITRNKIELRRERMLLQDAIDQAVEATQPLMQSHGHRLALDVPTEPVLVNGDLTRLTQVFANLLNNAAKYTNAGGRITLTVRRGADAGHGPDGVCISVADSGIGIEAQQLPAVFDMFTQLAPALGRAGGGLGIGLALARGIVELHGGTVEARSGGPGHGSEFTVHLQAEPVHAAGDGPAGEGGAGAAEPQRRILVVDDNVDSAETLSAMLGMYGQDVRTAFDGEEALRIIGTWQPDVAVLDIGMPGMTGYELCERVRGLVSTPQPKLIACTGWGQASDRERAREAGFDFHIVKPVDVTALLKLLASTPLRTPT